MSNRQYRDQFPNYDKFPEIAVNGMNGQAWAGWDTLVPALKKAILEKKNQAGSDNAAIILTVDCYSAVNDEEVLRELKTRLNPAMVVEVCDALLPETTLTTLLNRDLTDDRVFGVMTNFRITDFFDSAKLSALRASVETARGLVLIYGIGAALVHRGDVLVYADMARWEIQMRYRRKEACNWGATNYDEDFLRKYKRSFFIEWRVLDRHKRDLFMNMDFVLDTNRPGDPALMTGAAHREGLRQTARRPFRLVPFFDPGPWGGQWIKEVCQLDPVQTNYAWCFDCVPEENSLYLSIGGVKLEIPSINLIFLHAVDLLGDKVHARFGTEFPIRFDFLDTMDGGNLSLQVHPLTEYIQEEFGMHYTQDESYYLLDAGEDATVFLGIKTGISPDAMLADLRIAQTGTQPFPDKKYINQWPAKKHDHFLIPAGTIHCSGKNSMVLEISATPYIFTFKLWDWGRLGLDGKPRPVHLNHGAKNIQWYRNTEWVQKNLLNRIDPIASGPGWREERTGLHEREFIETRRTWFDGPVIHHTNGSVNVLNLVEGTSAIVESPTGIFEPFEVHYAETFVIPAAVGTYIIRPAQGVTGTCGTIKAYVRI